jgi:hypothetical protein
MVYRLLSVAGRTAVYDIRAGALIPSKNAVNTVISDDSGQPLTDLLSALLRRPACRQRQVGSYSLPPVRSETGGPAGNRGGRTGNGSA